jgi:hypothetical protein
MRHGRRAAWVRASHRFEIESGASPEQTKGETQW